MDAGFGRRHRGRRCRGQWRQRAEASRPDRPPKRGAADAFPFAQPRQPAVRGSVGRDGYPAPECLDAWLDLGLCLRLRRQCEARTAQAQRNGRDERSAREIFE